MFDAYDDSPTFTETKAMVVQILKAAEKPMTIREIKKEMTSDTYLWDCLLALESSKTVRNVGSLMISRWQHRDPAPTEVKTRVCSACKKELPLVDFYQEWSGAPSAKCKVCKTESQKRRGRKRKND